MMNSSASSSNDKSKTVHCSYVRKLMATREAEKVSASLADIVAVNSSVSMPSLPKKREESVPSPTLGSMPAVGNNSSNSSSSSSVSTNEIQRCIGKTKKGTPCTYKACKGQSTCRKHMSNTSTSVATNSVASVAVSASASTSSSASTDSYTPDILISRFNSHKAYVTETKALILKTGNIPIRLPNMPEDISENIAKFIIHYWIGDKTSKWTKGIIKKGGAKIPGDLISTVEKAQEVKCFTSDGPPTFGPTEHWDVIYFLDARRWLEDHFVLWRIPLTNLSKEWKGIKVNAKETFDDHCKQGRRPRITWEGIYPQIKDHCSKVFDGTFAQIFTPPTKE